MTNSIYSRRQIRAKTFATVCAMVLAHSADADTIFTVTASQGAEGIANALRSARELRRGSNPPLTPVRIVLDAGEYVLDQPLTLGPDDSGTAQAPLIIEAKQRGTVQFVGARRLSLKDTSKDAWRFTPYPALDSAAERSGGQFYVNGRRAVLAREPKEGSFWLVAKADNDSLIPRQQDFATLVKFLGRDSDRAVINLMQSWTSGEHRISSVDLTGTRVELIPKSKWSFLKYGASQRYFVSNLPSAWDTPGEWIASEGAIAYRPLTGDSDGPGAAARATAYWPRQPFLLLVQGTPNASVHHVKFQSLKFAYSGIPTPPSGWQDNQAASQLSGAIEMSYATEIALTDCAIEHIGAYAVWLKQGVRDSYISGCVMDDLGAGAIKIGMEKSGGQADKTSGNKITHNVLMHTGRQFPGGVGIWIGRSFDNEVSFNIIAHTSYTGISVGWSWGYEDASSGNNKITDNALFDIGQGMLSDLGAIYTLGRSPGTVISGNFIRQVEDFNGYGAGAWGIYNDEGSTDILVENNVVVGTHSGGYQLHYGRDIVVRDNLFAQGRIAEVRWANIKRSGDWRFENNGMDVRPNSKPFEFHNNDQRSGANTLRDLQAGKGVYAVQVTTGKQPADVRIAAGEAERLVKWRQVISNAQTMINKAYRDGVANLDATVSDGVR